nr:MAG TPA: protein of unknown function (DUF4355) [Caudoviricetes sp.]
MEETTTTPAAQEAATETTAPTPAAIPPWEREGVEFNPETAWNLIQNLRADNSALRAEKAKLTAAPAAEPPAAPEPAPDLVAELQVVRAENLKLVELSKAGLPAHLAGAIAGSTADEIQANIAALQSVVPSAPREVPPNPAQGAEPAPVDPRLAWLNALRGK